MINIEQLKTESSSTNIIQIELNDFGDYVMIPADEPMFFDRFVKGYKSIINLADDIPARIEEIKKKYKGKEDFSSELDKITEISSINVNFSEEAVKVIDGIFADDVIKKYFRDVYEVIPNFLPDADCIIDFFENVTPTIEKIFNQKMERQEKQRKARMAKYQPQDHKKPQRKGTK